MECEKCQEYKKELELWKSKAMNEHKRYMETSKEFDKHEKRIKEIEKFHKNVIDFLKDKEHELLNRLEYNMDYKKSKQKVIIQANFLDKINKRIDKMYGRFK